MLPIVKRVKELEYSTPQKWQTALHRNFGLVENRLLARVLKTDEETLLSEAKRLGIERIK